MYWTVTLASCGGAVSTQSHCNLYGWEKLSIGEIRLPVICTEVIATDSLGMWHTTWIISQDAQEMACPATRVVDTCFSKKSKPWLLSWLLAQVISGKKKGLWVWRWSVDAFCFLQSRFFINNSHKILEITASWLQCPGVNHLEKSWIFLEMTWRRVRGVAGTSQETCIQIGIVVLIGDTPTNWTLQPTRLQAMQGHGE